MQQLMKSFDALPRFFQVAFVVFVLIPIWSAFSLGSPLEMARHGQLADWAAIFAYWLGPIGLCFALFLRMHLVIFLFMTECAALLVHATVVGASGSGSPGLAVARAVLVACVAILGFAFLSRDVSMPFFSAKKRGFRGASRLRSNSSLRVTGGQAEDLVAEMEDCSLVGMAFGVGVKPGQTAAPFFARGQDEGRRAPRKDHARSRRRRRMVRARRDVLPRRLQHDERRGHGRSDQGRHLARRAEVPRDDG